ncbi:dicarboxylate/amino acid:cation symporter [Clostridium sp. Cult2]|uniref:dicarboxylate/amino acid:cation symporter n=1 Tax=Clostridium sp. Cult2 TaxID=2079003 RepID=UPI001F1FD80D|nr:dicarboxylate/amino acid:cation symporter [Clostridium sp. Cult2]MCF6464926.1 hypothetical protein [Clostridium sp. Cult2]
MEKTKKKRQLSLSAKIMIGLILGIILGIIFGSKIVVIKFLGDIFMRLLRMCIYPLILLSIIKAISSVADISKLRKIGGMFIGYVFIGSSIAATFGIISMKIFKPGAGMHWDPGTTQSIQMSAGSTLIENIISWIPDNPFASMSEGNLVQIVFFAIVFGIILAGIREKYKNAEKALDVIDGLNEVVSNMINMVLKFAPIGICSMMAVMVGTTGFEMLASVGTFLIAYWVAILAFAIIVLSLFIKIGAKLSPLQYYKNIFPVIVMAFTSLSSVGTLPVTMNCTKKNCGVADYIVDLIAAPAATINMNGAAAEYASYIIFASYIYDIELSIAQIAFGIILCVVMSIGAAGVPGGGIIMSTITLSVMGLPQDIVPVIAGVYTLLDLGATVLNVIGDTTGMVFIASKTGDLDKEVFYAKNVAA